MIRILFILFLWAGLNAATTTVYVNSGSTAGGDGTTNNTTGTTRAYKSVSTAYAAAPATLTGIYEIIMQGPDTESATVTLADHGTTTANYFYIHSVTDTTYRHAGIFQASKAGIYGTQGWGIMVAIACPNIVLEGLEVSGATGWSIGIKFQVVAAGGNVIIKECIVEGLGTAQDFLVTSTNGKYSVINCLCTKSRFGMALTGGNLYVYNTTFANNDTALNYTWLDTRVFKNCLFRNTTYTDAAGLPTASNTYCVTDKASAASGLYTSGTGNRFSQAITFVDSANGNYHLASTDTAAIARGTDLHADATYPFNWDVDLQTRPNGSWDVGFDQYAATCVSPTLSYAASQPCTTHIAFSITPSVANSPDSIVNISTLPASLTINKTTGVISGTPMVSAASTGYTIRAYKAGCGNVDATLTLAVIKYTKINTVTRYADSLVIRGKHFGTSPTVLIH
jgi:Putative Ig domain.